MAVHKSPDKGDVMTGGTRGMHGLACKHRQDPMSSKLDKAMANGAGSAARHRHIDTMGDGLAASGARSENVARTPARMATRMQPSPAGDPAVTLYSRLVSHGIACMRRRIVVSASLLLLGTGLLAGCGQKGPLFLPIKPAAPASAMTSSPAPTPATSTAKPAPATTSAAPASASSGGG